MTKPTTSTPARYRLLVLLCRLLRHPSRREVTSDHRAREACLCNHINFSDIPFTVAHATRVSVNVNPIAADGVSTADLIEHWPETAEKLKQTGLRAADVRTPKDSGGNEWVSS